MYLYTSYLTRCILETLEYSEDPDEMQHNLLHKAAFHQGLHCLLKSKQFSGTKMHHIIEISTSDPLKYKMFFHTYCINICYVSIYVG